jgi:coenzyme F420-reducing hydrogenase gamma subunit
MATKPAAKAKPKLAVYKFSSCDGCQLQLLELEDELLALVGEVEIGYFLEARRQVIPGPYDIGLVEGSISTPEEAKHIRQARKDCRVLVSIGACATAGGIQALRNWADVDEFARCVYPHPEFIDALDVASPVAAYVYIDFELRGCPVNKYQLVEVLTAILAGRRPQIPAYRVCLECKRNGTSCVMVSRGVPCLGPITQAGCGAICPKFHRGCYGCFGPMETPNIPALCNYFESASGVTRPEIVRKLRNFNGYLEPFKTASDDYEQSTRSANASD